MHIKCARKLLFLFMWLLYVLLLGGGAEQRRVCVSRYYQSAQKRCQKVSTTGLYVCAGSLILKFY